MSEQVSRSRALWSRWLGVGLAAGLAVVTLGLAFTGRLSLYISPESVWFAVAGAVVTLAGAVWSCTLPLGAEMDHDHDHGTDAADAGGSSTKRTLAAVGSVSAGVVASAVVIAGLVLPPASLSVELAMSRAGEAGTLFAGADTVTLGVADTSTFGVGDWASVFATATRPESYDGSTVTLTGFVTPGAGDDEMNLSRLVITHCVIDAQPASIPVVSASWSSDYEVGQWVEITGTITADAAGTLSVEPTEVTAIDEPGDPYEY
ncbi:putative repeat protein (TIGR03943 family) [Microbacterium sp. ZKA21]|uniref:TIGR03943 family putative permease subunit n=1 Tax=Microbacterium sp. ZKA21 TaxID=3381694 RepID=UPI003D1D38B1